jgi:uncharacterized Zn finger protein
MELTAELLSMTERVRFMQRKMICYNCGCIDVRGEIALTSFEHFCGKVLCPRCGDVTTYDVVIIPKEEGEVLISMYIATSKYTKLEQKVIKHDGECSG